MSAAFSTVRVTDSPSAASWRSAAVVRGIGLIGVVKGFARSVLELGGVMSGAVARLKAEVNPDHVQIVTDAAALADCDFVVEAIVEELEPKGALRFAQSSWDMVIVDEIAESTARFVVNPVRFRTKYDELTALLERLERNVPA